MFHRRPFNQEEKLQALKKAHTPEEIRARLGRTPSYNYLKDFVYGAIDGTVTTFAVVSGVAGAQLSDRIVMILGVANMLADGFSMAVSNYLGTRTEAQMREKSRRTEQTHLALNPEGEKEEIRQILILKGFEGEALDRAIDVITADAGRWINTMLQEEYDLPLYGASAWKAALATFTAFVVVGSMPLLAFWWNYLTPYRLEDPFFWSTLLTGLAFLAIGAAKGRFVEQSGFRSALETLLLGGGAAALSYGVGVLLQGIA